MLAPLDVRLFNALNRDAANPVLDWVMPRLTGLHHQAWFIGLVLLFSLVVLWRGSPRARVWVLCTLVAVGLSDLVAARVIKPVLPRDRPCHQGVVGGPMSAPGTRLIDGCPGSRSFPSNHAANMMAVAAVGWTMTRGRGRWLWFLLPLVIGYSRVYLGYHYPFDVLGGWFLGALVAALTLWLSGRWMPTGDREPAGVTEPAARA